MKFVKNADPDKYVYNIGFDSRSKCLLPDGNMGKNVLFLVLMSSSVHIDHKKTDILILGIDPTQGLDDTILATEAEYSTILNFSRSDRKFCLHYNGSNSSLFVNATKIYQFKAKDSEIKIHSSCLGNISGFLS